MAQSVIAVFDIGRTNKKFCLLNRDYELVHEEIRQFPETEDEDGFLCEDLSSVLKWMKQTLNTAMKNKNFTVRALNFSAYGAALVHVNRNGKPVAPVYNYWKPISEKTKEGFFGSEEKKEEMIKSSQAMDLSMLNTGLQLYSLKYDKPEIFSKVHSSLFLPQFCSSYFTGKNFSELSSLGLHSLIWNFEKDRSQDWIYTEKLNSKLPPVINATAKEIISLKNRELKCGIGIQDSLATLVPYQLSSERSYIALSTGCWSVAMNPFNTQEITSEELKQDTFKVLSYKGEPVRATRLFLGREHDYQVKRIADHFGVDSKFYLSYKLDTARLQKLSEEKFVTKKFFPVNVTGTGPFPDEYKRTADLSLFEDESEAYTQLLLDLAFYQKTSLELVIGNIEMDKVFVSGGFSFNQAFLRILATMMPNLQFFVNTINRAAVLGAALVLHNHWNSENDLENLLSFSEVPTLQYSLEEYQTFQ
ncbi:MAG: carbohydrate kinase [Cytophagales bacterium]|nr:carbohydrate kinase [Cytophagales bacterium]